MCTSKRHVWSLIRFTLSTLLASSSLCSSIVLAASIDENRLWLPRTQHELKPQLVQAAQLAATAEECAEIISGELDANHSDANTPVFLIVCRNPAGYTYSVYITNAGKPNAKVEKAQGGAVTDGQIGNAPAAKGATAAVDDKTASKNCIAALKQRTAHMTGIELDESNLQRLEPAAGDTQYEMDFDAADPSGLALHFHAVCRVAADGTALIDVKPRHVEKALTPKPQAQATPQSKVETEGGSKSDALPSKTGSKSDEPKPAEPLSKQPTSTDSPSNEPKSTDPNSAGDDGWEVVE